MAVVHLHHLFDVPKALEGVAIGYAMCGKRVPRAQLTKFKDDTTCAACLARLTPKENPGDQTGAKVDTEPPLPSGKKGEMMK
jgi:hypothetical protein